jgi:hypothetical protein
VGLQSFERRLERLVEGTFSKAFRSGLQPVEVGRRMARVLDDGTALGVSGQPVAPNNIGVYLSPTDFERFHSFADALARELAESARQHARDEGYQFVGSITVTIVPDGTLRAGDFDVVAEIAEAPGGRIGSVVLSDGRRIMLGDAPVVIGRVAGSTITVSDPRASRRHAEIRPHGDAFVIVDLGSTNGTVVNGARVHQQVLHDGDEIAVGTTVIRFEAS